MTKQGGAPHPNRVFQEPKELLKAFEEYKADVEKQGKEWQKIQYVGKDGEKKTDNMKVPLTMQGFKRYCRLNYGTVFQYFSNDNGMYDDYKEVCEAIKNDIQENQIIGGMLGVYNPSITQRLNGLVDKTEANINATVSQITGMEIK